MDRVVVSQDVDTSSWSPWTRSRAKESPATAWWMVAVITVFVAGLVRVGYLVWFCSFDLAPDEAYYWEWSRQLDWCYYSKGPVVAWLIRAADVTCGQWLHDQYGTRMPAVRLPAVICGQLLALGCFCLTWQVSTTARLAYWTMLVVIMTPHHSVISTLITIDSPFLCCWQWALVLAWHALGLSRFANIRTRAAITQDVPIHNGLPAVPGGTRAVLPWVCLGLVTGLGILAKPTMVLFPLCLALFLLVASQTAGQQRKDFVAARGFLWKRFGVMLAVTAIVGGGPILYWNTQHDWVTFRHVLRQASLSGSGMWRWWGWLEYLGVQTALLFGSGMLAWVTATLFALSKRRRIRWGLLWPVVLFLLSFSWPVFVLFAGFSLRTSIQPNWPASAYLSAVPLGAVWLTHIWSQTDLWSRGLRALLTGSAWLGAAVTVVLHRPELAYQTGLLPTIARLTGQAHKELWPRRFDPTCRLQGWRELALQVDQLRQTLRQHGEEPILAATWYGLAAELAFYLPDQPRVYCISLANDLRLSQYDVWRPNPTADPQRFAGRTFLCVGPMSDLARAGFTSVQAEPDVVVQRFGYVIARERIYLSQQFRAFLPGDRPPSY